MFMDLQLLFSDAQAITATAGSTNSVDMQVAAPDLGTGQDLYVWCSVSTVLAGDGDSTMDCSLQWDGDTAFGSANATRQEFGSFADTSAAGTTLVAKVQPGYPTERYLRAYYLVADGNYTTGNVDCGLVETIQKWKAYPNSAKSIIDS